MNWIEFYDENVCFIHKKNTRFRTHLNSRFVKGVIKGEREFLRNLLHDDSLLDITLGFVRNLV